MQTSNYTFLHLKNYLYSKPVRGFSGCMVGYGFAFNGMEKTGEVYGEGNEYSAEFRQYDSRLGRWLSIDPLALHFPWQSPYVGLDNNPIKLMDPNGDSTFVSKNKNGTYSVVGGTLDNDNGIYIGTQGKPAGSLIGYSATPESFYDPDSKKFRGTINPNDNSGRDFLNKQILADNPNVFNYGLNATKGEKYDFKRTNGTNVQLFDNINDFYRGMPILDECNGKPVFASARDVGNIAAGVVAGRAGLGWAASRIGLDLLESYQKGKPSTEKLQSQFAQKLGHRIGLQIYMKTEMSRTPGNGHLRNMTISKSILKRQDF